MLVRRLVVIIGLFGHAIAGTLGPIHSASVAFFCSYGHDTNIPLIIRPSFEATAFILVRTRDKFLVEEFCYFIDMHPNINKSPNQEFTDSDNHVYTSC